MADAAESETAAAPSAALPAGAQFFESEWTLWEHRQPDKSSKSYEDNMQKLCEMATVEDFWRAWNNIPKPSQLFFDGRTKKRFANRTVEGFSLFKKNINPEWEDAANRTGAEWFCRKQFPLLQLDELWLHLALGLVGETIDPADELCGVRIVDKSVNSRMMYRLELWFRRKDQAIADNIKERMETVLGKYANICRWEYRPHGSDAPPPGKPHGR